MPDTSQSPPSSPMGNSVEAWNMMDQNRRLQRGSRTQERRQLWMECRCLMDHVAFEEEGDEPDEPQVTGG